MSDTARTEIDEDLWIPPHTFRDALADTERIASELVAALRAEPSLFVAVTQVEFLAKRVHQLARDAHAALPLEVT